MFVGPQCAAAQCASCKLQQQICPVMQVNTVRYEYVGKVFRLLTTELTKVSTVFSKMLD